MTRPIFFNKCGHYKYEKCVCPVCYPITNFIETMMRARDSAERWADANIDDQMFDGPNEWSPPLKYRDAPLMGVVGVDPEPR